MKYNFKVCVLLGVIWSLFLEINAEHKHNTIRTYEGKVSEKAKPDDIVTLNEPLYVRNKASEDEICGYTVYKSSSALPFKVELKDRKDGSADIVLERGYELNYETRHRYKFEIAAHDCKSGQHYEREKVFIQVTDVDETPPVWDKEYYDVDVEEGKLYTNILQLEVSDSDGSEDYSKICHFHILTPNVPFTIDSNGILKNTEALSYDLMHNYILEVKAEDCGSRLSDKLMVNVKVLPQCHPGWKGIPSVIDYTPGNPHQPVADEASLDLCKQCSAKTVSTQVKMSTDHIGKGCDRDTYSIQTQRKMCGASENAVDLLPNPAHGSWTKDMSMDDGSESDQIFHFDGKSIAIEVPGTKFNHTLEKQFTLSTWLKHEEHPEDVTEKGEKEHILCNADGEGKNRHHYSLFIHNCRLVLLLRQESAPGVDLNVFKPAEWRWKLGEVCDGDWHHYTINVDFPNAELYVDGLHFGDEDNKNPEIIDDWPLHPSKKVHFTKLVIGACYEGTTGKVAQYLNGYLAGLSILNGQTETPHVIKCLNECQEKLDFHAMREMESGMSIEFNSDMTWITIAGHNVTTIENLVRKVGYQNARRFPTPGHRSLTYHTEILCDDGSQFPISDISSMIVVMQAEKPIITLSASPSFMDEEHEFEWGVQMFRDLLVESMTASEQEEIDVDTKGKVSDKQYDQAEQDTKYGTKVSSDDRDKYTLDSCMIQVIPAMNLDVEHIKYPENLLDLHMIEAFQTENGLVFSGAEKTRYYQKMLREVRYVNRMPETLSSRKFILTCSELNGRFVSNELEVEVSAIHKEEHHDMPQAHAQAPNKISQPVKNFKSSNALNGMSDKGSLLASGAHSGAGVGMIVIIVVCVGFLCFMIVLGVIRIRAAHQRTQEVAVEETPEMEWDQSEMTITVNPMEQDTVYEENELNGLHDDSSDDDDCSDCHDDLESSEEETEKVTGRDGGLEWDDSTLSF